MPEGDVVWSTAQRLHAALAGQVLTRSDFRVPRYATVNLTGQLVTEATARGKHLLIRTGGGLTVHTHLKMEGYWRIVAAGERPPGRSFQLRLLLGNSQWLAAGFLLGITEVLRTAHEDQVVGHLGPDLLGQDWDAAAAAAAAERLAREPGPSARRCLTSGTWRALGPSTRRRRSSCRASTRGGPPGRSKTCPPWQTSGTGCSTRTRRGRGMRRPETPGRAWRPGCTGGRGGRAGAAGRRSGKVSRVRPARNASGTGARTASGRTAFGGAHSRRMA